jgi:hypothetical protein
VLHPPPPSVDAGSPAIPETQRRIVLNPPPAVLSGAFRIAGKASGRCAVPAERTLLCYILTQVATYKSWHPDPPKRGGLRVPHRPYKGGEMLKAPLFKGGLGGSIYLYL